MSESRKIDPFSALILILSIIGIVLIAVGPFAGFYLTGYGYRYSCFDCEYFTEGDLAAQIIMVILLIILIIVVLNDLVPKRFIEKDLEKYGFLLSVVVILMAIIGLASFGVAYAYYEWWPETGFYGGIIAGLLNTILFFLKYKNK